MLCAMNRMVDSSTIKLLSSNTTDLYVVQEQSTLSCSIIEQKDLANYIGYKLLVTGDSDDCTEFVKYYNMVKFSLHEISYNSDITCGFENIIDYFSMVYGRFENKNYEFYLESIVCSLFDDLVEELSLIINIPGKHIHYYVSEDLPNGEYTSKDVDKRYIVVNLSQPLVNSVKKYLKDSNVSSLSSNYIKCVELCGMIDKFNSYNFIEYFIDVAKHESLVNPEDTIFKTSNFPII